MHSRQRSLNVIVVPADERQPPGWFAMHPDQFTDDAERHVAHGRWHCLSSQNARIYRALQFRSDLPANGLALDWQSRNVLGVEQRGAVAERKSVTLDLRPARLSEYPRCLWGHPSPAVRLGSMAVALFLLLAVVVGLGLGYQAQRPAVPSGGIDPVAVPAEPDAEAFLHALAGAWRAPGEQLHIHDDKGVTEIIRQTRGEGGEIQLELHAAAPVQFDAALNQVELDTPGGRWLLKRVPGQRHTQLVILYPDKQQVVYE